MTWLRDDGSLIAWGNEDEGQTVIPTAAGRVVDIAAGAAHNLAIRDDGSVLAWGKNNAGQAFGLFTDMAGDTTTYTNTDLTLPRRFFRLRE